MYFNQRVAGSSPPRLTLNSVSYGYLSGSLSFIYLFLAIEVVAIAVIATSQFPS